MKKIVCISCVKSKSTMPCMAKDMYISALFKKMYAYAEFVKPDYIFILSAEYGLIRPEDVISPYEKTLNNMPKKARLMWAEKILSELRKFSDLNTDDFVFLAGEKYREYLIPAIKNYDVPMRGLSFGRQLQWLEGHK